MRFRQYINLDLKQLDSDPGSDFRCLDLDNTGTDIHKLWHNKKKELSGEEGMALNNSVE